ncbi:MAG: glycosyltransferase family 2 protein [Candidatus Ventricola sp.]
MSKVRIIVPVYNVEKYVARCLDSILAQNFIDYEVLLIDDGSEDQSGSICDEYAKRDARIQVIHQSYLGVASTRNIGLDWALAGDSEWIMFVDSDDYIHPLLLETLYAAVHAYGVKIGCCMHTVTDGEWAWSKQIDMSARLVHPEEYYVSNSTNATVVWGKLYHRECFRKIRFPAGKIHEDEYVTYRVLFAQDQIALVDMPMYAYFANRQGITKSNWTEKRLDCLPALNEQLLYFKENGFDLAYADLLKRFRGCIYLQNKSATALADAKKRRKALFTIRYNLKKHLIWNRNAYPFIESNLWYYEWAFPIEMRIYWYMKAVLRRME